MRHLARTAGEAGIDYCYLVHTPAQAGWASAVRADIPRGFSPTLRFLLVAGWQRPEPFPDLDRIYVDIRDL